MSAHTSLGALVEVEAACTEAPSREAGDASANLKASPNTVPEMRTSERSDGRDKKKKEGIDRKLRKLPGEMHLLSHMLY